MKMLNKMIEEGERMDVVVFHKTVPAFNGNPEYAFYSSNPKVSRVAELFYHKDGFVLVQEKGKYKVIIPLANVAYAKA